MCGILRVRRRLIARRSIMLKCKRSQPLGSLLTYRSFVRRGTLLLIRRGVSLMQGAVKR